MTPWAFVQEFRLYLGLPDHTTPAKDIIATFATSLIAILSVLYFSKLILMHIDAELHVPLNAYVLTSIAATSVLVFAVPHGALSQPWPVFGGHFLSALVGVLCLKYIHNELVASAAAVSISILLMSYFRCLHPPGGATALGAVLGGDAVNALGYSYILVPTLLNCSIIILAAVILNFPLNWRRYPAHFYYKTHTLGKISPADQENEITIEDFLKSIHEYGSYFDITDEGWIEIFENSKRHAALDNEHPTRIKSGHHYSNGKLGKKWEIRSISSITRTNVVQYTILAGLHSDLSDECSVSDFLAWAKFEVHQEESGVWVRSASPSNAPT